MIINSLTFGLIVGILSFTIAAEARLPPWISMMGYANTTVEDVEEFDREMCGTNEKSTTYEEHKQSRVQFGICVSSLMAESRGEFEGAGGDPTNYREAYGEGIKGLCRRVPKLEDCIRNFTDSIKTCLDVSKHETAEILYNAMSAGLRFMCKDRGARIKKYFIEGGQECVHERRLDLLVCVSPVLKYVKKVVPNGAALGGLGALHLLVPDVEKCKIFDEFQTCIVEAVKECPNQLSSDIANPLFNEVSKAMTCYSLLGKSKASPSDVSNVLLTIASTALMSLRFI